MVDKKWLQEKGMKYFQVSSYKISVITFLSFFLLSACSTVQPTGNSGEKYMQLYEQQVRNHNDEQALKYLQLAAQEKDAEALARLGEAYLNGRYGLDDPEKALSLLQEAAEAGSGRAMTNLGIMYLDGTGVGQDYATALSWFERATEAGDMKAPRYIGLIYENGWGKTISYEKAAASYQIAAGKGDITSQYYWGRLYEKGLGVQQDYAKARELYLQSAARGDIICLPAIMALGNMFEQGLGVTKSIAQALQWYAKGSALGDVTAKAKIAHYQYPENPFVMNVKALVKILGDGQKVAAVAIEYKDPIDETSLQPSDYSVPGREVAAVYVNDTPAIPTAPINSVDHGNFVIVQLKTAIEESSFPQGPKVRNARAKGKPERRKPERPGDNRPGGNGPATSKGSKGSKGFTGPKLGEISDKPATAVILSAKISQSGEIKTEDGEVIPASGTVMESNLTLNPDIKDFVQLVYHDTQYNKDLMYNLYVPKEYDPAQKYPLVLFMHDAGVVSNNPIETLTQGLGAVIWASKDDQTKHPCFVLAPQYNAVMVDDSSQTSDDMDVTVNLLKSLLGQYSIDPDRLYNTGQSMGGMTSIAMDIKYPDLFAASLLVACQWDPALVKPLANKPLWIVVSQGDSKANPGMDAITSVLKSAGQTVATATWNAEADQETLSNNVKNMLSKNADINYTVFEGGDHRYTWQYAYSITGIRDWLFRQHK